MTIAAEQGITIPETNSTPASQIPIAQILEMLPHRYPFILLDRVLCVVPGKKVTALKNVTINEAHFLGHFPKQPVMPGVLILEALAQACAVLAIKTDPNYQAARDALYLLAGIDNARFKKVVEPGDQLIIEAELLRFKQDVWRFSGVAKVKDQIACTADFLCVKKDTIA